MIQGIKRMEPPIDNQGRVSDWMFWSPEGGQTLWALISMFANRTDHNWEQVLTLQFCERGSRRQSGLYLVDTQHCNQWRCTFLEGWYLLPGCKKNCKGKFHAWLSVVQILYNVRLTWWFGHDESWLTQDMVLSHSHSRTAINKSYWQTIKLVDQNSCHGGGYG